MRVIHWIDDDAGYSAWLRDNPGGYLANINKIENGKQRTRYLKIHLASHKLADRSNPESVNPWTGNKYAKVTSSDLGDLLDWLKSKGFEVTPEKYCFTCGLGGEGSGHFSPDDAPMVFPDEVPSGPQMFVEGATQQVLVNQYERDRRARSACIRHWGTACYVCGFDFQKTYGDMGRGFIHVHHLTEIASIGAEYEVDPLTDLRPVCPNCHAMLHTRRPAIDIDELKSMLTAKRGSGEWNDAPNALTT
ncbi:5-methylcytosine-specific restriction enzyme A [Burkholderia multivorans]